MGSTQGEESYCHHHSQRVHVINISSYQDAVAIVCCYGKPDLFITFACNPNRPEITDSLLQNQTPADRLDVAAQVFKLKLKVSSAWHIFWTKACFWQNVCIDISGWLAKMRATSCSYFSYLWPCQQTLEHIQLWFNNVCWNTRSKHTPSTSCYSDKVHDAWTMWYSKFKISMHGWWPLFKEISKRLCERHKCLIRWVSTLQKKRYRKMC